jgi:hypothetical protein
VQNNALQLETASYSGTEEKHVANHASWHSDLCNGRHFRGDVDDMQPWTTQGATALAKHISQCSIWAIFGLQFTRTQNASTTENV